MKDLKCGMSACVRNKAYSCVAKTIRVSGRTDCKTYTPSEEKRRSLMEAGEDFATRNYSVDTEVKCDAKCVFNRDRVCYANGITVMSGKSADALCFTFIKD